MSIYLIIYYNYLFYFITFCLILYYAKYDKKIICVVQAKRFR